MQEDMGEIVSNVATILLAKLATKAYQEIASAYGLKDNIEKLRYTIEFIGAYLQDAENKQAKDLSITKWLQQLKEAFWDANDILDEVECQALRNQVVKERASVSQKACRFFSCSNSFAFRFKMSSKIRDIREKIKEIASIREKFGLVVTDHCHDNDGSLIQTLSWRETHSNMPSRMTGRDQEKEKIIDDLMRPNSKVNKIDVIPIVGLGGLGKTTLAQLVYNDKSIVENFQLRIWVCVSEEFEIKKLMLEILKAVDRPERDAQSFSLEQVKTLLHMTLHEKKFLLVLDDVWNENVRNWQQLEDVLLGLVDEGNKNDSKVIVTTRSHNVALVMGNVPQHNLEELPRKECLELFLKCAFPKGEEERHPRLKKIGEEIVEKCKGVPLAVVVLGCLLYLQHDEREWKKIRDNELWELDQNGKDGILPALKLSYNQLTPQLKQCFSLCSIFPKDYLYNNLELISFWMAHGLLQVNNDKEEAEYVGELYIKKLVASSFFQYNFDYVDEPVKVAGIVTFKMHDLVHDLARSTMISEQTTMIDSSKLVNEKVRHLSFSNNASLQLGHKLNEVRTIMSRERWGDEGAKFVKCVFDEFKYLRVLDFQDSGIKFLPDCLGDMKHLRYLNLQGCFKMKKLPYSICKLQNLQYLNLLGCKSLKELPRNLGRYLVSLRNLMLTVQGTTLSTMDIGSFKCLQCLIIGSCDTLVSLPWDLSNLTCLKKLVVFGCPNLVTFEGNENKIEGKSTQQVNDFSLQIFAVRALPKLTALPNWLTRYAKNSLNTLYITGCEKLSSLPADLNEVDTLQHLYIVGCNPELEAQYREGSGPEKTKLAHVHIHVRACKY